MKKYPDDQKEILAENTPTESDNQVWTAENTSGQIIADLKDQLKFQKLISEISAKFVNLPAGKVDSEIENGLKIILEYMGIDRCTVAEFSKDKKDLCVTHSYYKPGFDPAVKDEVSKIFPWYGKKLLSGENIIIEKPSDFPDEAVEEKALCQRTGLKSILTIPVSVGGSLLCAIGFLTSENYLSWPKHTIAQLTLLSQVFANAIYRKRAEEGIQKHLENLKKQVEFERLISALSAKFVNLQPGQVHREFEKSLKVLVEYLGADRATFFRISKDRKDLIPIDSYSMKDVERLGEVPLQSWFPWAAEKILHGDIVHFSSEDELPAEADYDRANLKKLKLKSTLTIPLFVDDKVEYALGVSTVKQPHKLQEGVASRLQLVGEIFINALIRSENMEIMQEKDEQLRTAYKKITKISEQLAQENRYFQDEIKAAHHSSKIVGISGGLKYIFYRLKQVAPNDTTVLITGETGTGKELIARVLHELSQRKEQPLIKVDCTTLHDSMIESELFGHEKGSFTSAHDQHTGRIELANNATLFLDEVGEIPFGLQAKLLRVIEDGEFERLGSTHTRKVNLRVISATNRNLDEEVQKGKFRQDLFYRLNIFPLSLPPLRERKEDIPLLADQFVQRFNIKMGKNITEIPEKVLKSLQDYSWPGNVRELENVIERAMITTQGSVLQLMDVLTVENPLKASPAQGESLQEMEQHHILKILEETYWRIEGKEGAALKLGLHPDTLRSRMKKLGIRRPSASK